MQLRQGSGLSGYLGAGRSRPRGCYCHGGVGLSRLSHVFGEPGLQGVWVAGAEGLPMPAGSLLGGPLPTQGGVVLGSLSPVGSPRGAAGCLPLSGVQGTGPCHACTRPCACLCTARVKSGLWLVPCSLAALLRCHPHAALFTHMSTQVRGFCCCVCTELWPSPLCNSGTLRHPQMKPTPISSCPHSFPHKAPSRPWMSLFWMFHTCGLTPCGASRVCFPP